MSFTRARTIAGVSLLSAALFASSVGVSAFAADKAASPTTVKIGYFNLALVKASTSGGADSEALRQQAESQLRRDLEEGQKKINKAKEEKKPEEEIKKLVQQVQTELAAKQQALAQLVQAQNQMATERLAIAVNQVAKDKGLDLIVDGGGIFAGGQKVLDSGVDCTEEIVAKLTRRPAATASGETKGTTK